MPVFAVKASRTFWKFSCSEPPHRDVTVMAPLTAGALPAGALPAAVAGALAPPPEVGAADPPPPPHAAMTSALVMRTERKRSDRFIDHLRKGSAPSRGRDRSPNGVRERHARNCSDLLLLGSRSGGLLGSPLRVATRRC